MFVHGCMRGPARERRHPAGTREPAGCRRSQDASPHERELPGTYLAAEIASPNQYGREMGAKARRYLRAGTRLVWIVWPRRRQVDVWCPGDQTPSQTLGLADSLDGLDVVPGFTYPLAKLFA